MLFVQPCTEQDIPHAAQLMCKAYSEAPWNEAWQLDRAVKRITALSSGISARGYKMIMETEVIGYLFGRMDMSIKGDIFYVNEIFVHPMYQRKGCGSMALNQLAEDLKKIDVMRIELHTIYEDISFYKKNGFSPSSYQYLEKEL